MNIRIFNVYGERMRAEDGRVVSNFLVQAILGKPLTVYGDGSQTRSFCYVDDEVRGFLALLDEGEKPPGSKVLARHGVTAEQREHDHEQYRSYQQLLHSILLVVGLL